MSIKDYLTQENIERYDHLRQKLNDERNNGKIQARADKKKVELFNECVKNNGHKAQTVLNILVDMYLEAYNIKVPSIVGGIE